MKIPHKLRFVTSPGFTIIELLVVIVVIGILATITTSAYGGMSQRADATRIGVAAKTYATSLEMYYQVNNAYPDTGIGCLGTAADYPVQNGFIAGSCVYGVTDNTHSVFNSNLNTALSTFIQSPPSLSSTIQERDYGAGVGGVYKYRGAWVEVDAQWYQIQYYVGGDQQCPRGSKTYYADSRNTRCLISMYDHL